MHTLTAQQVATFRERGYLVVDGVLADGDLAQLRSESEEMVETIGRVVRERNPKQIILDGQFRQGMVDGYSIEWEWENPNSDTLKMVRYFFRRWPCMNALAWDPRFSDPVRDLCGDDDVVIHSDKFNLKVPGEGSEYYWHQDLPFFRIEDGALDVERCITAILFLDDATEDNGCIVVAPGSHHLGLQELGTGTYGAMHPKDPAAFEDRGVAVPMTAGSALYLDPLVLHRSGPNRSTTNRRNLLYTYQPRPISGTLYDDQGLPGRLRAAPFS